MGISQTGKISIGINEIAKRQNTIERREERKSSP